jgi:hypothetical protein
LRILLEIIGHAFREKNVAGITAIHHPLRDIDPRSGNVCLLVQISDFIDRTAVNAHAHAKFGMTL